MNKELEQLRKNQEMMEKQKNKKKCSKCKNIKNVSDFHKDCTTKDGYHHCCKECKNKYSREINKIKKSLKNTSIKWTDIKSDNTCYADKCNICGKELNRGMFVKSKKYNRVCRMCLIRNKNILEEFVK